MQDATKVSRATLYRNRASLLNAQAARLRGLRNEMTFSVALKQSRERMRFVQTVQSFDDAYAKAGGTKKLKAATEAANLFHSSALLQTVIASMKTHDPDSKDINEEGVAFYDSDPEDSRPRNSNKCLRRVSAIENQGKTAHFHQLSGYPGFDEIGSGRKVSKKLDEDTIVDIVQVSTVCVFRRSPAVRCGLANPQSLSLKDHEQRAVHAYVASYTNTKGTKSLAALC
jgi:hypothetical protein